MASLKPWHKVVEPRDELREGRRVDASDFAVHLDKARGGTAPDDDRDPRRFFDRAYLTTNLLGLGGKSLKRFLVEAGAGADSRFWKLAQSLSALYPSGSDEKRWVDGVLGRKKGLGL